NSTYMPLSVYLNHLIIEEATNQDEEPHKFVSRDLRFHVVNYALWLYWVLEEVRLPRRSSEEAAAVQPSVMVDRVEPPERT
ncbi:6204_t:CDS:1, partial [Paraglomus occultum]